MAATHFGSGGGVHRDCAWTQGHIVAWHVRTATEAVGEREGGRQAGISRSGRNDTDTRKSKGAQNSTVAVKPTVGLRISNPNFCTAVHLDPRSGEPHNGLADRLPPRVPIAREGFSANGGVEVLGEHAIGIPLVLDRAQSREGRRGKRRGDVFWPVV